MKPRISKGMAAEALPVVVALAWCLWTAHAFLFSPAGDRALALPTNTFSTAVGIAAGKGWLLPEPNASAVLNDFLDHRTPSFDPAQWPDDAPMWEREAFAETHAYLLYTLGYTWKLFGINWTAAKYLQLAFFAASALLLYGIFRIAMGPLFSAAGMLFFAHAPAVLTSSTQLRDFGKTPWLYASLLLLLLAVARPLTLRRYWLLAAGYGLTLGFGLGFRQDLIVGIPIGLLCFVFLARSHTAFSPLHRAASAALLLSAFYIPAAPILRGAEGQGTLMYHNMINGLATESEQRLRMGAASYEQAYMINDNFAHAMRESYARRVHDPDALMYNEGVDAARWGRAFMIESIASFPGDFLTRALGACRYMFEDGALGITESALPFDEQTAAALARFGPLAAHLDEFGLLYAAAALLIIAHYSGWTALSLLLIAAYFAAYPSLQLQVRHAFPMTFLGYGAMLLFWSFALRGLWLVAHNTDARQRLVAALRNPADALWLPTRKNLRAAAVLLGVGLVVLAAARAWQASTVRAIAAQCREATLKELPVHQVPAPDNDLGWVSFSPGPMEQPVIEHPNLWEWRVHTRYLAVELKPSDEPLDLGIRYDGTPFAIRFAEQFTLPPLKRPQQGNTLLFFPVYEFPVNRTLGTSAFTGVALKEEDLDRFVALHAVEDISPFRLLPLLHLPADSRDLLCWKTVWPGMPL
jgi:hypothetical protein